MELGKTFFFDFIANDPATGIPSDTDETPVIEVFEDDNDTPIQTLTATKRTGKTGNYRVRIEATTANGYEKGKSYNVIASAEISTADIKLVAASFLIDDTMDKKTNVAALMNGLVIPDWFIPDFPEFTGINPGSLESHFGPTSDHESKDLFQRYYNLATGTWTDGTSNYVPADFKAEVLNALQALEIYNAQLKQWQDEYNLQRDVQWRAHVAEALITATE